MNGNTIHSTYSVQEDEEEEGESKVKPVKTKISSIRKLAPSAPTNIHTKLQAADKSRYRKRHNNNAIKTVGLHNVFASDSGQVGSHDAPKVVNKSKRNPQRHHHIQSLTTSKPRNSLTSSRVAVTESSSKHGDFSEHTGRVSFSYGSETPSRLRTTTTTSRTSSATTTTVKPSRNVAREAAKFIDKPKKTGYRGSVRFGQSTTTRPV